MRVLKERITSENAEKAISYCREYAKNNPPEWQGKFASGYFYAAELMRMIKNDQLIIHIYTNHDYEFKFIQKKEKNEKPKR